MKKKVGLGILLAWIVTCIIIIYGIRGSVAAYIWCGSIFIIAPAACVALLGQTIAFIVRAVKKKKVVWNLIFMIVTAVIAYPATVLTGVSPLTYPTRASKKEEVSMHNPVKDGILIGGKAHKSHAVWPSECYAYDILKTPYDVDSSNLNDYGIYLADVIAPVSGTVIGVKEDEEDIAPHEDNYKSFGGNYIYIRIEETGTYVILAHLEKDSVKVNVGDSVKEGDIIAKVGNSGTTSQPHLHIQHQKENPLTQRISICAQGLPIQWIQE